MGGTEQQSDNMDVDDVGTGGDTTPSQRPEGNTSGTGSSALPAPPGPPPPLNPPTGDTTQTTHRSGSINSGTGPAVAPPPPTLRGLPNTPAPPPGAAKKGAVGDPQSTPLPPSPAPTPASKSGTTYLTAAQEKAKLAQATNSQGVPPGALNSTQPSGSNVTHVVQAPKKTLGEDPFGDEEGSPFPPPSYETGSASGHMQQAIYQSNLASPGPGCFYIHTAAGFIPIPNPPPPGIDLFVLGADGRFYQAPNPSAAVMYPSIPPSATLSPGSAVDAGLIGTPAPDPATASLRAMLHPKPQGSPPDTRTPPAHARIDADDALEYFDKDSTNIGRPGRPNSISYDSNRGGPQKVATRQRSYPLTGHGGDPLDVNHDEDIRSSAAAARNYMSRSQDLNSRLDEDEDDDSNFLNPDQNLARRQERGRYDDEDDDDGYGDLPEHPPGHLPEHPPGHLPDYPPDNLPDRPSGSRRPLPQKPSKTRPLLFYEENEKYYEFTNFAPYPVTYKEKVYPTSEHLFQARKFLGHRPLLAEHIRRGSDRPRFAFIEARRFAPETRPDWKEKSIEIMEEILELKFTQHEKLRRLLLDTGERYLIENAGKYDDFWGNGADGKGRNELGKALMRLRDTLREEDRVAREAVREAREAREAATRGKGKGRR